ncbi:ESX-1 associated ATP-binding protein EpsI N-terminal domain-containing protein, partial [Mycobacterium tuberculosis]|uniref:ESX-1 associated ATP-binding protein EpsI N-terminal domain-containing protein n=1 Tax=Mycobacterium tuberculosis TaxID=1773 RepID=UPI0034CFC3CC
MAADYDKLFRPHEGMEAPDDMAAQPFFDPSASFPPAPASANLPKPNGQTPPPTSDDLSERFVSWRLETAKGGKGKEGGRNLRGGQRKEKKREGEQKKKE